MFSYEFLNEKPCAMLIRFVKVRRFDSFFQLLNDFFKFHGVSPAFSISCANFVEATSFHCSVCKKSA